MSSFRRTSGIFTAFVLVLLVWAALVSAQTKKRTKSDAQIKQEMIAVSIASYSGSCPCPYNTDRAGRRCGGRSAYSRRGGAQPLCYAEDITQSMVDAYRRRTGQ